MKIIKINLLFVLLIAFGCAPRSVTVTLEDVEKQRLEYLDGKLKSLSVLVDIYSDKNQPYNIRVEALRVLSESRHPVALEAIHESVSNSSLVELDLMLEAIKFLINHGNEKSSDFLVSGLLSTEEIIMEIRKSMINALSIVGSEDQVLTVLDLYEISKKNHDIMNDLLTKTLGSVGDESVIPMLIEIANNDEINNNVRNRAIEVLSRKESVELVDFFVEMLGDPSSNIKMKNFALNSMGEIKEERMIMALLESYQSGKKEYQSLLNTLIEAMGNFQHPRIKVALIEIAKSNDFSLDLRIKSLQALSKFEDSSVLDDIIGMLEQSENYIFYNEIINIVNETDSFDIYKEQLRDAAFEAHKNNINGKK